MSSKTQYEKRKAAGLCPTCGHRRDGDSILCGQCRGVIRACGRAKYAKWKAAGLCLGCGRPRKKGVLCTKCHRLRSAYQRDWARKQVTKLGYRERKRVIHRRTYTKLRVMVMAHYGNRCACCGETEYTFLTLDHVNNDGAAHRLVVNGAELARWTKKNGYPDTIQILCWNCQMGKQFRGVCPHVASAHVLRPH